MGPPVDCILLYENWGQMGGLLKRTVGDERIENLLAGHIAVSLHTSEILDRHCPLSLDAELGLPVAETRDDHGVSPLRR